MHIFFFIVQDIPVDFNELVYTCGYYSFGTYRIYPANHVETEPVLIRYSGRLRSANVHVLPEFFKPDLTLSFYINMSETRVGCRTTDIVVLNSTEISADDNLLVVQRTTTYMLY